MKTLILNIALLFTFYGFSHNSMLVKADSAYEAQDYAEAVSLYSEALANGNFSASIYYNLGNAFFKNNEIGEALWAYHKAKKINPKYADISFNLNYASSLTLDKIEQNETGVKKWIAKLFYGQNINFWAYLALVFITIASAFYYLYKTCKLGNKRRLLMAGWSASAFLCIVFLVLAFAQKRHVSQMSHGIITETVSEVRTAPNSQNSVAFELHEGAKFTFKQSTGDWYRITVGKNEGWIPNEDAMLY